VAVEGDDVLEKINVVMAVLGFGDLGVDVGGGCAFCEEEAGVASC
jgi:hypothetical protein